MIGAVAKEIEPLLVDGKGPFYGGSEKLTLAEVCSVLLNSERNEREGEKEANLDKVQSGSFLLRILGLCKSEYGLLSAKLPALLNQVPKFKRWAEATVSENSVNYIWDEKAVAEKTRARFAPAPKQ